jgi:hypothetical protein
MRHDEAKQISRWIYEEPYSVYSMDESDNCIKELLNGNYFSALDNKNNLVGYYCFGESAQVPIENQFGVYESRGITDIGLGIKPNLCGQGYMKINSQVYVTGSTEAVEMYCKAFGAEISFKIKTEENTYAHCELSVNGQLFLAVSEAPFDCNLESHLLTQTKAEILGTWRRYINSIK